MDRRDRKRKKREKKEFVMMRWVEVGMERCSGCAVCKSEGEAVLGGRLTRAGTAKLQVGEGRLYTGSTASYRTCKSCASSGVVSKARMNLRVSSLRVYVTMLSLSAGDVCPRRHATRRHCCGGGGRRGLLSRR